MDLASIKSDERKPSVTQSDISNFTRSQEDLSIDQNNSMTIAGIKLKDKSQFIKGDQCSVCDRPSKVFTIGHNCRVCGKAVCSDCSNKRINQKRACDFCFMKKKMSGQEARKREFLKSKDETLKRLYIQIQEMDSQLTKIEIDCLQEQNKLEEEKVQKEKEVNEIDWRCSKQSDALNKKIESINKIKNVIQNEEKLLKEKEKEKNSLQTQVSNFKSDISSKKQILSTKLAEFKRLKQQEENLQISVSYLVYYQQSYINMVQDGQKKENIISPKNMNTEREDDSRRSSSPISGEQGQQILSQSQIKKQNRFKDGVQSKGEEQETLQLPQSEQPKADKCEIF